jgi:transposase-like protein
MKRVTEEEARQWLGLYDDGISIEQIALEVGRSPETVRRWLHKLEAEMRSVRDARSSRPMHTNIVDGVPGKSEAAIKRTVGRGSPLGHRRRGRR